MTNFSLNTHSNWTPRFRFEAQDKVTIDGIDYVPRSSDSFGHVFRRLDIPDLSESFSHEQIETLRSDGALQHIRGFFLAAKANVRNVSWESQLKDLSEKAQRKVLWRKAFCDRFLQLEAEGKASRADASMKTAIDTIHGEITALETKRQTTDGRCGNKVSIALPPSPTALRKWLKRYEIRDVLGLHDGYTRSGNRRERFTQEEREMFREFAASYASRLKPTKADLYGDLLKKIKEVNLERTDNGLAPIRCPSYGVLEREIADLDPFLVAAGREGTAVARKRFHIVAKGVDVTRPLERVEMDEWKVSLQTLLTSAGMWERMSPEQKKKVERKRVWMSAAIDVRTRCILAVLLTENPCGAAAVSTLEMAVCEKTRFAAAANCQTPWDMFGIPETIATDSGSSYISHEFCMAVTDLESEHLIPPAGLPQMRGTIERTFRTVHQKLIARFDGRTFENVAAKGEYDSEANAILTVEELGHVLIRWVVDVYHNTPHAGLGGETPRGAWLRLTEDYPVIAPPSDHLCRHIFGATMSRRLTNKGIRFLGLDYQSLPLQKLRRDPNNKEPLIRVDHLDLGHISVRMKEGWLSVPCQRSGMDGVTAEEWIEANRLLKHKFADGAARSEATVDQALREIRELAVWASDRAGIGSALLSANDYTHEERNLFRMLEMERPDDSARLILGDVPNNEPEIGPSVDVDDDIPDDDGAFGLED